MDTIEALSDPRVADYRDLKDAERCLRQGLFVVEGRILVRRLLESRRFRVRSLLVTGPALEGLRDLLDSRAGGPRLLLATEAIVRGIVGYTFHRGCLAVGERGVEPAAGALIEAPGPRLLLALENLADPDNVGGIFRNARAFGAHAVLLSPGCADPLYRKAIRVSMGGSLAMPFARLGNWPAGLGRLREAGYTVVALTPAARAADIAGLGGRRPAPERVVLLLGAEGQGLSAGALAAADLEVRIPMAPGIDSLNVAVAAGIALHRVSGAPAGD